MAGLSEWNLNLFGADGTTRGNVPAQSARGARNALRSVETHDHGVHHVTVRGPRGYVQRHVRDVDTRSFVEAA